MAQVLRLLNDLGPEKDPNLLVGLNAPDDAAAFETPKGDVIVSSVDAFRAFVDDPYLVGRVAAVNAVSDLYATGAEPRYALAIVAIPKDAPPDQAEEILFQVLAGARAVFDPDGVSNPGKIFPTTRFCAESNPKARGYEKVPLAE